MDQPRVIITFIVTTYNHTSSLLRFEPSQAASNGGMQEASMSLQSIAVLLPYKETPVTNSQLPRFNKLSKSVGSRWTRRRLLVTNGASQGREPSKELRLDQQDLMAIEFGRLLGESKEKTISKVLRRKIDPNSTYIDLEKEAKAGKELVEKADFAVKVERPKGPSRNGSMLGPDVPRLASPPLRRSGVLVNLPKNGASADVQESFDDCLLHKPLSSQSSEALSSIRPSSLLAANNVNGPDSQSMKAMEQTSVDANMLHRPSVDKGSTVVLSPRSVTMSPSQSLQPEISEMPEYSDSRKASKLEFQRLLDKAFNTSNADPPVEQSNLSTEPTAEGASRLMDAAAALPNLASPPSRHRGSPGTFIQPAQKTTATSSSTKNPPDGPVDESLLRKPGIQASSGVALSSAQSSEEIYISQDYQSHMPPDVKDHTGLDEAAAIPQLAAPPSRHRGSFGKFIQPRRAKTKDLVDNSLDESLLRKPSFLEKAVSIVSTPPTEDSSTPLLTGKQRQTSTTQIDNKNGHKNNGLKGGAIETTLQMSAILDDAQGIDLENPLQVGSGSDDGNEVLKPVLKIKSLAQSPEDLAELGTSDAFKDAREASNRLSYVPKSGRLEGTSNGSTVKHVKVGALKKPARVTFTNSAKGLTSEEREDIKPNNPINDDSKAFCEVEQSMDSSSRPSSVCAERDDSKTVGQVEESVETLLRSNNLIVDPRHVSSLAVDQASFRDQQREQEEQLTAESVALGTDQQAKSINMLRRPSQHTDSHHSELANLEASNPKLHQAKEEEEKEWARAEALLKAKEQVEVKMIGSNSAGLFVSLGCLVGFLPSFELSPKRGLVDFSSWAQQKGYGLSQIRAVKGGNNVFGMVTQNVEESELSTATEGDLNDLRIKYREEVSKLISSFVGERTKVIVKLLDKGRRKLRVSEKEADLGGHELLQKKADLMAQLKMGEVVSCQVKSITPIGVFVEVDGVPALIHHSEVSWNTRLDPASLLSIGEVIKAKVCRLDRTLQRINLSLKQMQPDPLKRTLESVVGDLDTNSSLHEVEADASLDVNWPELGDLISKLEKMDHISSVSKGRCLYSSAFAPTFQVLISTPQSNGYKLLARFENKIQEILVDTTLNREKMKECIRLCTFSTV
ncbi:hypothetical protein GOP47_0016788 [Adiantum capillus-veneris]|uniref:S1 motif domain-containing protein n=1 Tax=Adiantum capillus-veneris TaxID=13818 RepID=A0A9D4UIC4_ADICA|nr:hypothetical protein GOP47_0016788 [Adiantum capillus-veneris]